MAKSPATLLILAAAFLPAADWPQFRGPNASGVFANGGRERAACARIARGGEGNPTESGFLSGCRRKNLRDGKLYVRTFGMYYCFAKKG